MILQIPAELLQAGCVVMRDMVLWEIVRVGSGACSVVKSIASQLAYVQGTSLLDVFLFPCSQSKSCCNEICALSTHRVL